MSSEILFLLGIALLGGIAGGRLFQRLRIPQVVGYIIIGIIVGQTGFKIIDADIINIMQPFNYFALGVIGFMIGGELKKEVLKKYGRQFLFILLGESLGAFLFVLLLTFSVTYFFFSLKMAVVLSLLLAAISSATAPAVTSNILWEYKTRGPLTTTVLGIVALDDSLALMLFAIASSIVSRLINSSAGSNILLNFLQPIYDIAGSVVLGAAAGFVLIKLAEKFTSKEIVLTLTVGTILFVLGFANVLKVDMLLAAMAAGIVVTNSPYKSKKVFGLLENFSPPVYVLFFVLFGAKLVINKITLPVVLMIIVYFLARTLGKMFGAKLGGFLGHAGRSVKKYLPFCLFSQAGVAIGFSILVAHKFPGEIGNIIIIVVTVTTLIVEMVGPPFTKMAVQKAGEVGLNITEEDLMMREKVSGIMDSETPLLAPGMTLKEVLRIFSENTHLYYPVINSGRKLMGIVTIDTIRETFLSSELYSFLVALDLMSKPIASIGRDNSVFEAKQKFEKYGVELLPVIDGENRVVGVLKRRAMRKLMSRKLMELQNSVEE